MKLTAAVAAEIATRAKTVLDRALLVADNRGVILAGSDPGTIAVDALRSCQEGRIIRAELGHDTVAWCPFVYENHTVGAFGVIEEGPHTTPEAISLLQGLAEVITHQHFLLDRIQPTEKMRAIFLRQVLSSPQLDALEVFRQADILQLNLRSPQALILAEIEKFEDTVGGSSRNRLSAEELETHLAAEAAKIRSLIAEKAFHGHPGNIVCYLGKSQFAILKGIGGEGLTTRNTSRFLAEKADYIYETLTKALPGKTVSLGVGQYYPELGGLRKSYQEARLSLIVGTKVWGPGHVYHIKKVGMFITLANVAQERKAELAHQILHPLLRDEQLYKTVQTFLTSGLNLTEAAEKLHVHRNTLIYRLDKTKKVIGLDPRRFDDALQIKLGLMFYQEAPA